MKPASAGAMMRVPCQMEEFKATALSMTRRSIRCGIEGLAGRLVERFNRSCAKSDDQDVPHLDNIEEGESPKQEDEASREALGGYNQATLIDGVGKNPTKQVQANGWDTTGDTHVSQGQGGTRQLVDQPVLAEA